MIDNNKLYSIYKIVLIPTNQTIYIGMTSMSLKDRLHCHVQKNNKIGKFLLKNNYTRRDLSIEILEYATGKEKAFEKEYDWTLRYMNENAPLLNECIGSKLSEERKLQIGEETSNRKYKNFCAVELKAKSLDKLNDKFYIYLILQNDQPIYIGHGNNMYVSLKRIKSKFNLDLNNVDFKILKICQSKKELNYEKEKFIIQYSKHYDLQNIQTGNHPSRECILAGTKAAQEKKLGVPHTENHKQKISQANKGKNIGFDRYTSVMIINLIRDKIFIYGDFIKQEKFHYKIDEKLKQNIPYTQNDGYILAEHLDYNEAKHKLNKSNFELYKQYIIKPHKRIDKRKIRYKNEIFNSITDLSHFCGIDYEQISLSIAKNEDIYHLIANLI